MTHQSDPRNSYWSRPENRREPCWRANCPRLAATVQDGRFRGRYCPECLEIVTADADAALAAGEG